MQEYFEGFVEYLNKSKEAINWECYWRVINGQSGGSLL